VDDVIRSTVIKSISESNATSNAFPIAYFYCARDSAETERADPGKIMGAILKQLARPNRHQPIKEPIATEYERRRKKAEDSCPKLRQLTIEDCTSLILELTRVDPAVIIIDALDECEENSELLKALDTIVSKSGELVKVFVSSREDVNIVKSEKFLLTLRFCVNVGYCLLTLSILLETRHKNLPNH